MPRLFLATRNAHKTREFAALLGPEFSLTNSISYPDLPEVIESGASFEENAQLKAVTISQRVPGLVLADDSGLEVESLGGAPGVYSARYAGEGATDAMNRQKLLAALAALPAAASRRARFHCALGLAREDELVAIFTGMVEGEIVRSERGGAGFGYDPLFQPDGFARTFAELSAAEKNAISHRAMATAQLRKFLRLPPNRP